MVGEVLELLRLVDMVDGEGDVPRQLAKQLHLLFIEEADFAGVQRQHPDGFPGDQQRQHHQRAEAARLRLLFEQDPRILRHVLDGDEDLLQHRAPRQPAPVRAGIGQPQGHPPDVLVVRAPPRYRLDLPRRLIHDADPRHPESAGLDRHAAAFAEQLVALAHPDDRRVDAAQHGVHAVEALDFLLRLLALGDVGGDAAVSRETAGRVEHGLAAGRDVPDGSVGQNPLVFKIAERLARGKHRLVLVPASANGRNSRQLPSAQADRTLLVEAPALFMIAAGELDEPVLRVLRPKPVGGQQAQAAESLLAFPQPRLVRPPLPDVARDGGDQPGVAGAQDMAGRLERQQ
jgi:hypothetical protein